MLKYDNSSFELSRIDYLYNQDQTITYQDQTTTKMMLRNTFKPAVIAKTYDILRDILYTSRSILIPVTFSQNIINLGRWVGGGTTWRCL